MSENSNEFNQNSNDELSTGLKVLSFCIPLAGAIIYFTKKDKEPKAAKAACYAALIGMAFGLLLSIGFRVMGLS